MNSHAGGAESTTGASRSPAHKVRRLRREKGLSISELALKSGVSKGMVSQLERGISNPSVRTMERLSQALGTTLVDLLGNPSPTPDATEPPALSSVVLRREQRPGFLVGSEGLHKQLLSPPSGEMLRFMLITVPPGTGLVEALIGPGEKGGLVLRGRLVLVLKGEDIALMEGDSFQFSSEIQHTLRNDGSEPAEVLWIMAPRGPATHF